MSSGYDYCPRRPVTHIYHCINIECNTMENRFRLFVVCGGSEKSHFVNDETGHLSTLATDPAGKLDVLGHDGHTLGVDGAKVGILEQSNEVSLAGLLKSHH